MSKRGVVLDGRAREIVCNVDRYFETEKERSVTLMQQLKTASILHQQYGPGGNITLSREVYASILQTLQNASKVAERVYLAAGINKNTLTRIRREKRDAEPGQQQNKNTIIESSSIKSEVNENTPTAYLSNNLEITAPCNLRNSDNEGIIIDTRDEEAQSSNLKSTVGVATASTSVPTTSKHQAPKLLNTVKKKLFLNQQDFIKVQDALMSAKKVRLMSVPNPQSNKNITLCTPNIEVRPDASLKLLKLPPEAVSKPRQNDVNQEQETELEDGCAPIKQEPADNDADFEDNMTMDCDDKESTSQHGAQFKDDVRLHEEYHCDVCSGEIRGFRYTCVQCSDLDLCGACEATAAHNQHYVLRVPQSKPSMEIQFVLATIRQHLMKKVDACTTAEHDHDYDFVNIKSEVKSEPEDEFKETASGAYPSAHSEVTSSYNPGVSDNKDSIDTSEEEAPSSNLNSTVGVATASAAVHTTSILHAPDLFNTAKNKSHINLQDFIKAQDACMPGKLFHSYL